jgi:hypothetical protein
MDKMSTLSESQVPLASEVAQTLLLKRLNDYQSAKCHLYAARAHTTDHSLFSYFIEEAEDHLANKREAWKTVAAAGILGEYPQVSELAAEIEELRT